MPKFFSRLVAVAVAAAICTPAFADPQVPASLEPLMKALHVEKVASLAYTDEKGEPIDADTFAAQMKAGKKIHVKEAVDKEKGSALTFRLLPKEAAEGQAAPGQKAAGLKPGDPFPGFHLARLDGTAVDNKALEGRYTLVSFYFSECGPCISEVPALNTLAAKHKDINLLAATFDSQAESKRFVEEHHLSWPIAPDAMKLIAQANVKAYPTFALIDPQGKLVEMARGDEITKDGGTVEAWLDKKLPVAAQGAPVPPALAPIFAQMNLKSVASLAYHGEDGKPLDEATFIGQLAGKGFQIMKKPGKDGLPEVTLTLISVDQAAGKFSKLKAGDAFPEFHLTRLDGAPIDSMALRGRYTLVSFYFAGCGPCIAEVPALNALAQSRKDVNLLAVTFDSVKETKEFVAQHGLTWPIATDASKLTTDIGVRSYPTLALIDPQGKLVDVTNTVRDTATLNEWLDLRATDKVVTDAKALPDSIRALLKYHGEEKFSRVVFHDENGKLIDADAFAGQIKAAKKYSVGKKKTGDADPEIMFKIMSKEEIAAVDAPPYKLKPGDVFPEFHLTRLDGTAIDNKVLQGRYTLISFYFADCAPCVKEVPVLNELAARRKDIDYLAMTFDTAAETRRFIEQHHLSWPIVTDARTLTREIGVVAYPTMALVNGEGKLIAIQPGYKLAKEGAIDKWLKNHLPDGTD